MPPSRGQLRPLLVARGGGGGHRGETEHTLLNSGPGQRRRGARGAGAGEEGEEKESSEGKRAEPGKEKATRSTGIKEEGVQGGRGKELGRETGLRGAGHGVTGRGLGPR